MSRSFRAKDHLVSLRLRGVLESANFVSIAAVDWFGAPCLACLLGTVERLASIWERNYQNPSGMPMERKDGGKLQTKKSLALSLLRRNDEVIIDFA